MSTSKRLTRAEACDLLGIGPKQLSRHVTDGMPCHGTGTKARFPWPEVRVWRDRWLVETGKRQAAPTSLEEARRRLEAARAAIEELKLEQLQGRLMTVEQADRHLDGAFGRVRALLSTLPTKIAPLLLGLASIPDIVAKLEQAIQELSEELRRADDVPAADEADEDAAA